jgi:threonine aldolase
MMPSRLLRKFKSDNFSGIHPEVMQAIIACNQGHSPSYGEDEFTEQTRQLLTKVFGAPLKAAFVFNGTGANILSIRACLRPYQSLICSEWAHIATNETGAPESLAGVKLLTIPSADGKVTPDHVRARHRKETINEIHASQPKMLSIAQCTEFGTVYSLEELSALRAVTNELGMYLHLDACRIYHAAAHLSCSLADLTTGIGADIISLGGTKNGAMMAEAVLVFNSTLWEGFEYLHKNTTQLYSKNRFAAVQFMALLSNDLWLQNATHANKMAGLLAERVAVIPGVSILQQVEANHVFLGVPMAVAMALYEKGWCYPWTEVPPQVRLVCSFDTTEEDINLFVAELRLLMTTG